ncbi:hypothetical protein CTheo_7506 [Ceratobasidium theobromae]|uniref:Transmembrane protein n=1 Tax=Ceratobasidium theobromae TaxID=1582974 RepID=A0A5N5QBK8_9AGAM|nr:hypothetical protein CTheo_7506 [Ceratobasidium theobromae]
MLVVGTVSIERAIDSAAQHPQADNACLYFTFLSYLFYLLFTFIAASSALPEPVTGDVAELLAARQNPVHTAAPDGTSAFGGATAAGSTGAAAATSTAVLQNTRAIATRGAGGGAARRDNNVILRVPNSSPLQCTVWCGWLIATSFQLELKAK